MPHTKTTGVSSPKEAVTGVALSTRSRNTKSQRRRASGIRSATRRVGHEKSPFLREIFLFNLNRVLSALIIDNACFCTAISINRSTSLFLHFHTTQNFFDATLSQRHTRHFTFFIGQKFKSPVRAVFSVEFRMAFRHQLGFSIV